METARSWADCFLFQWLNFLTSTERWCGFYGQQKWGQAAHFHFTKYRKLTLMLGSKCSILKNSLWSWQRCAHRSQSPDTLLSQYEVNNIPHLPCQNIRQLLISEKELKSSILKTCLSNLTLKYNNALLHSENNMPHQMTKATEGWIY